MPGFVHLLHCVGKAVIKNGFRSLSSLVPFGEVAFDIAKDIFDEYRQESDLRRELESLAQASPSEVHQEAERIAAEQPAEVRFALTAYLDQMPATIRQSLRRPSDPSGKTFAAERDLQKPEDLLAFLPTGLPRFKPGDQPLAADWELVELLGKGGFGEVWKARHLTRSSQRPVALKFCLDPIAAHSLRNEAALHDQFDRMRRQGRGQGIVPLLETYLRADPPCLMYEYIEGGDLTSLMRERKMRPSLATRLVQRLASIVSLAHRLDPPLVHRDLKPANVLLRQVEGGKLSLFVADFGIGGLASRPSQREQVSVRSRTLPSAVRGAYTPLYASPQQIQGEKPHPRDDVHALGVMWYQLVTGNLRMLSIPPDWQDVAEESGLGQEHIRLLASCISSKPEKRPADAGELAERMKGLLNLVSPNNPPPPVAASPMELAIRGEWFARPESNLDAPWASVQKLPGKILVQTGEIYQLKIAPDVTPDELGGLVHLRRLPSLRSVDLSFCKNVTDSRLEHLQGITSLQSLSLLGCSQVTDDGLAHLQGLRMLQSLSLFGCAKVTDAGLINLRELICLQSLSLVGCVGITDRAIDHLLCLSFLKELSLFGTQVTLDGLAVLWRTLRECKISA